MLLEETVPALRPDAPLCEADARARAVAIALPHGEVIHVRPLRLTDEKALQDLFYRLSEDSSCERFLSHKSHDIPEKVTAYFESADGRTRTFVATSDSEIDELIAMASYTADPRTERADISLVVRDEWQGRGVGTVLFRRLVACARERGMRGLTADVLATNSRMMALFRNNGLRVERQLDAGVCRINAAFT